MDIQQTVAPAAPKLQAGEASSKTKESQDKDAASPKFSKLLQGLQGDAQGVVELAQDVQVGNAAAIGDDALADVNTDVAALLSLENLVGQTQRLDAANTDAALQDGSLLQQRKEVGLLVAGQALGNLGAQTAVAVGQQVATVAAGVQPLLSDGVPAQAASPAAAALAVVAEATGAADNAAQVVADGLKGDAAEGRVALLGAWKLDDPQMALPPQMQRLMGQVEQWAAATAGVQPKANERTDGAKQASQGVQWMSADQGSGTTLTDNAVQEAQQAQDAAMDARSEEPVEDMRFWLQGKQQRAEVVLNKDGQLVRVQVALRGNEAHVSFLSDQPQTRELLDASLEQLREMLQAQGLELAGVSVQADSQGSAQQQAHAQRSPWEAAPTQHAQVVVPDEAAATQRKGPAQGLSLYA